MYLCYKKSLAKTNTLAFKAGLLGKTNSDHLLCLAPDGKCVFFRLFSKHLSKAAQCSSLILSLQGDEERWVVFMT